jgi:TolB-like protein
MGPPAKGFLRFSGFTLDLTRGALLERGAEVKLRPKSFEALRYLVSHAGQLASKDELVEAVWGKASVSDESIAKCVSEIRAVLHDEAGEIVTTVPRRGYRFSAAVDSRPASQFEGDVAQPPRLSIVVMPFLNLGGSAEQQYFVDGVTENLTTDLSRIRGAFVIARNTAFTYRGRPVDVKQVGRELGVRYVLEGSVQRGDNRMRVNVQLIDAESGSHLWAERFDKPLGDLFDIQDEIVARLAGALNAQLVAAEAKRAEKAANPDATDLYFQGMAWFNKGAAAENLKRARDYCDQALTVDPDHVDALVHWGHVVRMMASQSLVADCQATFQDAERYLNRALSLVLDHARGRAALGALYIWTRRTARGIAECEHALALDRNLAQAHANMGWGKVFCGRGEETQAHIEQALRLSPRDPSASLWLHAVGAAKLHLGLLDEAVAWYRKSVEANGNVAIAQFWLAVALGRIGRWDEARAWVKAALALNPTFTIARAREDSARLFEDEATILADFEPNLEALRQAGLPEH